MDGFGIVFLLQVTLEALNGVINSWGLSLMVFAVLFRLLTLPLSIYGSKHQTINAQKMEQMKPKIAEIKQQHQNDPELRDEGILALYKEHGINPLSHAKGCLPLLIQLPILFGLFKLIYAWDELKGASFLWIADLSGPDRLFSLGFTLPWFGDSFNLLPILMFCAQVIIARSLRSGKMAGIKTDIKRDNLIYLMPITMTILFYPFPSGCMLFWTTGNILQILEQWYINHHLPNSSKA